ncbi:MAG: hypothetical protein IJC19_09055, partial [Clostridia bacterium]|nr:hypothetical protein [Clostridia bacterium]
MEKVQNRGFNCFFRPREISGNVPKKAIDGGKPLIQGEKLNLSIFLSTLPIGKYMQKLVPYPSHQ